MAQKESKKVAVLDKSKQVAVPNKSKQLAVLDKKQVAVPNKSKQLAVLDKKEVAVSNKSKKVAKSKAGAGSTDPKEVENAFNKHQLIPDVLNVAPPEFLKVTYADNRQAHNGKELTPTQVKDEPQIEWSAEEEEFYTLIMIDPDVPSRTDPKYREYLHWLVVNIPGNVVENGDTLAGYIGSAPPKGSGLHRYVFLVFKQPGEVDFIECKIPKNRGKNRPHFKTMSFVKKYKLGHPIAGNFHQAKWDNYVPTLHAQLNK